jgi:glycosyltransferase involved in cell wall biosynthesis
VLAERPDAVYLLAGTTDVIEGLDPEERRLLVEMTEALRHPPLRAGVRVLGRLTREQLARIYQIADVALVPSLYENCAYAAVEPMAAGVPVVTTATGGLPEIVEDQVSGLLVPVHGEGSAPRTIDLDALTGAQLRLLADRDLAARLAQGGRERVAAFSLEAMVEGTLAVYRAARRAAAT